MGETLHGQTKRWEDFAIDAASDRKFEDTAAEYGLRGLIVVQGSELPSVPSLAGFVRLALERSMRAALGPSNEDDHSTIRVRIRPGGGREARENPTSLASECGGSAFRFAIVPDDDTLAQFALAQLWLERDNGCNVCIKAELAAIFEEESLPCDDMTLQLEIYPACADV